MTTPKTKATQKPLKWTDAPELVTPPQAARLLGMHTNSIDKAIRAGKIKYTRVGRHRKIKKTDLAAYAGLVLDRNGSASSAAEVLATFANEIETAMALPAAEMLVALEDITERMKNH